MAEINYPGMYCQLDTHTCMHQHTHTHTHTHTANSKVEREREHRKLKQFLEVSIVVGYLESKTRKNCLINKWVVISLYKINKDNNNSSLQCGLKALFLYVLRYYSSWGGGVMYIRRLFWTLWSLLIIGLVVPPEGQL